MMLVLPQGPVTLAGTADIVLSVWSSPQLYHVALPLEDHRLEPTISRSLKWMIPWIICSMHIPAVAQMTHEAITAGVSPTLKLRNDHG